MPSQKRSTRGTRSTTSRQESRSQSAPNTLEQAVQAWLKRVTETEEPPESIVAFNLGLFQTADGYSAYLTGTDHFSDDDDDWACDEKFTPKERYLSLPTMAVKGKKWKLVLTKTVAAVKGFLSTSTSKASFIGRAQAIAVGFDDGDLVRVK